MPAEAGIHASINLSRAQVEKAIGLSLRRWRPSACRRHGQFPAEADRWDDRARLRTRLRRAMLSADRRLRQLRLSGKPRAILRHPRLCLGYLKCRHPAVFCAALPNLQPMGFYAPAQIVRDAREHDVEVRPIDMLASGWGNRLEVGPNGPAVRLGFRQIDGFKQKWGGGYRGTSAAISRPGDGRGAGCHSIPK